MISPITKHVTITPVGQALNATRPRNAMRDSAETNMHMAGTGGEREKKKYEP